ncbi:non-hydrolyzing UDP-N-acetylglucosamine 2-epimerase [Cerasicoccus fimbriatus]|uniref:non-hydrolyzing UDP-N-acetylglucosamine 2-epimerase n=1 Tax=Cerasicoccus fimbriatus TaxID=3014554 RepID=UPI0022B57C23|nr:UDP-N-acetylglucosamine 2-epimerase (non-hydrolyzing) [Cerasicoccus sp. TK19100]
MKTLKFVSVVGARPNFMKIAPFLRAIRNSNESEVGKSCRIESILVHTGQHYDDRMSKTFLETLQIPKIDYSMGIGSGSHAWQVGQTMIEFEKILEAEKPDWVVVVGDVNATCACSITAKKAGIKVAHIESGLRSFDLGMPEEINRMVTDRLSDLLLTTDEFADKNLRREGVREESIVQVGNIMIDTLEHELKAARELSLSEIIQENYLSTEITGVPRKELPQPMGEYCLITMHRPSNVDSPEILDPIIDFIIDEVAAEFPVIMPLHPRTRKNLQGTSSWGKLMSCANFHPLEPVGYREMLKLNLEASVMLTDSGGLQEECCVLGTPCLTLRENTERPVTLVENGGVSILAGNQVDRIRMAYQELRKIAPKPYRPKHWDGKSAERIVQSMIQAS